MILKVASKFLWNLMNVVTDWYSVGLCLHLLTDLQSGTARRRIYHDLCLVRLLLFLRWVISNQTCPPNKSHMALWQHVADERRCIWSRWRLFRCLIRYQSLFVKDDSRQLSKKRVVDFDDSSASYFSQNRAVQYNALLVCMLDVLICPRTTS